MDIRNSLDGLKSLLGVAPPAPAATQTKSNTAAGSSALASDSATLSSAGSEVSLTAAEPGVRMDKVTDFFLSGTDITKQLASGGGALGGDLTARDQDIPGVMASLDQLANSISTSVNAQNNAGTDLDGVTGTVAAPLNIFSQPAVVAGSAAGMSVVMTDPNQIAAAGLGDGTGDNSNATAMANLAKQSIVNGQTPTGYYSDLVATLGSTVSGVQTENTAQNASVTQLQTQNDALSSVNLNDEASSLTTLERSYQAASQVFAMLNTIMASALNLGDQTAVS
jgi:flagellar hook-associated protein 1 FlgK